MSYRSAAAVRRGFVMGALASADASTGSMGRVAMCTPKSVESVAAAPAPPACVAVTTCSCYYYYYYYYY